ncbi:MAG: ATP-binding protein [Elusimicrobia bacterium]|nr:ATP-binding protein [Elusimicrobiota bacterium]
MRRAWTRRDDPLDRFSAFDKFLAKELEVVATCGRSRATFRFACHGPDDASSIIDGMVFGIYKGRRIVACVGPVDPLYYGETTTVFDLLAAGKDKALIDGLVARFFSDKHLKGKVHRVDRFGSLTQVAVRAGMRFGDVVLPEDTERRILDNTLRLLDKRAIYRKNGIPLKRGLLFEGPPGNGKTMVCKALAASGRFTVFWIASNEPGDLHKTFAKAVAQAPSLVLIEDIDLLNADRGGNTRLLGEVLNVIDGLVEAEGVITIATTNYPEMLDKALAGRPSRFDVRVPFPDPDPATRLEMLKRFTTRQKVEGVDLAGWAERSDRLSGAQLRELCYQAAKSALEAGRLGPRDRAVLQDSDFESALALVRGSAEPEKKAGFAP